MSVSTVSKKNPDNIHDQLSWIIGRIAQNEMVSLRHIPDDLPEHANVYREFCVRKSIQSIFVLPIKMNHLVLGEIFLFLSDHFRV